MRLYINEISGLKGSVKITDDIKKIVDILLAAINDWPDSISTFEDYEFEVHKFINGTTSKNNLERFLKKIDLQKYAWQAESLAQVMELYQFYDKDLTLIEIIEDLKNKLGRERTL